VTSSLNQDLKAAYAPFTLAHNLFYDVLGSPDSCDSSPPLAPHEPPSGWRRLDRGAWTLFSPHRHRLPDQGWKVHVAACPGNARRVADITLRACWDLGVPVKALRTERTVLATQVKYAAQEASGKVLTVYPSTLEQAERLLDRLIPDLTGETGPPVRGEIPLADAPIYLRYGAFTECWHAGTDGRLRPGRLQAGRTVEDRRGAAGARDHPPLPRQLHRFRSEMQDFTLDVADVAMLHRSNGGAVYRAIWGGRTKVVLKEARRHTGLDVLGVDAVTRLRHEHAVLQRLAGTGLVPEVIDLISLGDSEFLVMEYIPGTNLNGALGRSPAISPSPTALSGRKYLDWVEQTVGRLRDMVRDLADRSVIHGDLHPGNILQIEDRLVLVDLESASLDGRSVSTGITALAVNGGGAPTVAGDLRAVDRIRLALISPQIEVLSWRPEIEPEIERAGLADLLPDRAPAPIRKPDATALVRGLRAVASPHRTDRLVPGDIAQFTTPGAALGLLNGASGVCLALRSVAVDVPETWLDWIAAAADRERPVGGLGHGLEAVALTLALLGRTESARAVARRAVAQSTGPLPPDWEYGHAGRALAFSELAGVLGDEFDEPAHHHLSATMKAVSSTTPLPGSGLLDGWSGVALALISIADRSNDRLARTCLEAAHRAVLREAGNARTVGGSVLLRSTGRLLPDLARGSAALGLACDALLRRAGTAGLDDTETDRLGSLLTGITRACRTPVVLGAGLALGRCGLLAVLRRLTGDDDIGVRLHEDRVGWSIVPLPQRPDRAAVLLGHTGSRLSADLATGSAGALVALAPLRRDALHMALRLPQHLDRPVAGPGNARPAEMTVVSAGG